MSVSRSQSEVIARLDDELSWREREIILFGQEVKRAQPPWQVTLIRAAVPLLYAHWEGYVKLATEAVISFVGNQRHPYSDVARHYWAIGLGSRLRDINNTSSKVRLETLEFILEMGGRVSRFRAHDHVHTESNLSSRVFVKIASTIGIDTSGYEVRFRLIDRELLLRRNHIAHGQHLTLNADSFLALQAEVVVLLRQYHADLQNHVVLNEYLSA